MSIEKDSQRIANLLSEKVILINPLSSSEKLSKTGEKIENLLEKGRFTYQEFVSWCSSKKIKDCKFDFIVEDRQLIFDRYKEISKKIFNHLYQDWGTKDLESIEKFFKEYFDSSLKLKMITIKGDPVNNRDIYRFHFEKKNNSSLNNEEILERIRPISDFAFSEN